MVDITKFLRQTAVYWASPVPDGMGGFTWADPVEIACRWKDTNDEITTSDGEQIVSRAMVMTAVDVDEQGVLFLGDLDDLGSAEEDDPTSVEGAFTIRRFDKIPDIPATSFIRKAFL